MQMEIGLGSERVFGMPCIFPKAITMTAEKEVKLSMYLTVVSATARKIF